MGPDLAAEIPGPVGGEADRQGHKAITSMRGSYGGVLMFGMLTSVAGLGMFNLPRWARDCCSAAKPIRRTWKTA